MDIWVGLFRTGVNVCMVVPTGWFDSRGSVILDIHVWCWGAERRGRAGRLSNTCNRVPAFSNFIYPGIAGFPDFFWTPALSGFQLPESRCVFVIRLVWIPELSDSHVLWASLNCCIPFRLNSWFVGFAVPWKSLDVRIPCCLTPDLSEFIFVGIDFVMFRTPELSDVVFFWQALNFRISLCLTLCLNSWNMRLYSSDNRWDFELRYYELLVADFSREALDYRIPFRLIYFWFIR